MAVRSKIRKRQYETALKREEYLNKPDRPVKTAVEKRPKTKVMYRSHVLKKGSPAASEIFGISASERSLAFFGGEAALGLQLASAYTDPVIGAPRFFTPAKVNAGVGLTAPTAKRSPWGSRVVKSQSANYSAPISGTDTDVTYDELDARAKAIRTAITNKLGDLSYATFFLSPELMNNYKQ
jgi:hypothetical protein